jgi:ribosomal protein L7/L12
MMGLTLIIVLVLGLGGLAGLVIAVAVIWMQSRKDERHNRIPEPVEYAPARPASPETQQQVRELVATGKSIEAIRLYREATGSTLKEAKDAVDAIQREVQ